MRGSSVESVPNVGRIVACDAGSAVPSPRSRWLRVAALEPHPSEMPIPRSLTRVARASRRASPPFLSASQEKQTGVTLPFYFICMLHLANEKGLRLEGRRDLSDFSVVSDTGQGFSP